MPVIPQNAHNNTLPSYQAMVIMLKGRGGIHELHFRCCHDSLTNNNLVSRVTRGYYRVEIYRSGDGPADTEVPM